MSNITKVHITDFLEVNRRMYYNVEVTENSNVLTTKGETLDSDHLKRLCNDNSIEVTYEEFSNSEGETLEDYLYQMNLGYMEVHVNADGSGEHDVYEHTHQLYDGKLVRDFEGKCLKIYKREGYAIKFAETFNKPLKLT